MTCPLCLGPATSTPVLDPIDGWRFTCAVCTQFVIDDYGQREIEQMSSVPRAEFRAKLELMAREATANNSILVIRQPRRDEITGDGHGVAQTRLIARSIPRN